MIKLGTGMECIVEGNFNNNPLGSGKDRKVVKLLNVRQEGNQVKADVKPAGKMSISEIEGNNSSGQFTATLEAGGTVPVEITPV
jgi:uncharacterized protein YacL